MLWFICFFNYADRQAIFAIFPVLEKELHFDKAQLGLIGAAFTWVYAMTAPFAGAVADKYPRKIVILGGLLVWSVVTGFTSFCSKVWHFVVVRGAEGLGETFYFPASMSLVSDYHSHATRSRAMSLHQTSVYAGTVGGSVFAGWMAERHGWQSSFYILGALGVVLAGVLWRFLREPPRNAAERLERGEAEAAQTMPFGVFLRELIRTPAAMLLIAAFFGANGVAMVFLTWMPTFLKEKFQLTLAVAGFNATFFLQTASLVGAMVGGFWADTWRRKHRGGRMWTQAVGAFLGVPFIFLCGDTRELGVLIGAMTAFGFCKGLYDANIWASLYEVVPPERRAAAVGLMNMLGWLGGGLGALLVGRAVQSGATMSVAISCAAVIYLGVGVLLCLSGRLTSLRQP